MIKRTEFNETAIALEPGDAFLLYTDGLFRWTKDERYRVTAKQLENVLDHSVTSAEAVLNRIVAQTVPENSAKTAPDDVAAIAVRREDRQ
jgi:serine phosphatase RsbU (regulator of sigma subunit)